MKLYEIIIKPMSAFGTPIKGDTLFGHFCWQAAYDDTLLNGGLEKWIARYDKKPFVLFSSAWPRFSDAKARYALKRPDLPLPYLFATGVEDGRKILIEKRKEQKKRKWMLMTKDLDLSLDSARYATDDDLVSLSRTEPGAEPRKRPPHDHHRAFAVQFPQPHNTINRLTMTTGEGMFSPFEESSAFYYPETEMAVFALVDEAATDIERVSKALRRIGVWGYGKNASTGLGRFNLGGVEGLALPSAVSPNACYTLGPTVPERGTFSTCFFSPFLRFGKHGDRLGCSSNPFKNPVIMADEGAVLSTDNTAVFEKPYVGTAVFGVSKAMPQSVVQGYSIYLPFKLET